MLCCWELQPEHDLGKQLALSGEAEGAHTHVPAISLLGVECPKKPLHMWSWGQGQARSKQHGEQPKRP